MATAHFIREFDFDITFASEEEAFEQHNRLGSFVTDRLTQIADEVFMKLSPTDGSVVSIDRLNIDLGVLPLSSWHEEAENRFRRELEDAIRSKLLLLQGAAEPPSLVGKEGILNRREQELEALVFYLETGYLPWNIHRFSDRELAETMRGVLSSHGQRLAAELRSMRD